VDAAVADYAAGGVPNPDLAGKEFLSLLRRLRYVFLQDAALLQPLAVYFRPSPAVLRPEDANEMGGDAVVAAAMEPPRPVAGQILQRIRQRAGSLGEYSARVDV
jgi:hypothetical protein